MVFSIISFLSARRSSLPPPLSSFFSLWWADDMHLLDFHFCTAAWKLIWCGIHFTCIHVFRCFQHVWYYVQTWSHICLKNALGLLFSHVAVVIPPTVKWGEWFGLKWPLMSSCDWLFSHLHVSEVHLRPPPISVKVTYTKGWHTSQTHKHCAGIQYLPISNTSTPSIPLSARMRMLWFHTSLFARTKYFRVLHMRFAQLT